MLLTITTTHQPATDLGYLLHKHPARLQAFNLSFGTAHVFYPEATDDRCTATLLLDIDPVGLVRGSKHSYFSLGQYVNNRPYVASSFLSTAIAQVYGTALNGRCKDRPELVTQQIPLQAQISVVPSPNGTETLSNLFEPLGYIVEAEGFALDPHFPDWGQSPYYTLTLSGTMRLADLLTHLYVLIPVLDADKHYYIGQDEVEKLLSRGEGWLADHPERNFITRRYLKRRGSLVGEGMVVKPYNFIVRGSKGLVQPAIKCRGREYLRIIYGPEYTLPENIERLRKRGLGRKRAMALREFALGIEALERFVRREPLRRVHECVFGVLAMESEPVDPRL